MDSNASEKKSGEERDLTEGLLMRVIVLTDGKPECKEVPLPLPLQGEVLIKVFASQVSEGDLTFSKNPSLCGFSGSGLVIASGGGWFSNWNIVNTRVAFISNSKGNYGTWAEYIVLPAQNCVKLEENVSFSQAALGFSDALRTIGMLEMVQNAKSNVVVQTSG